MNANEYNFTVPLPKKKLPQIPVYWGSCDVKIFKVKTGTGRVDRTP